MRSRRLLESADFNVGRGIHFFIERRIMSRGPLIDHFPGDFLWSNATLILKGMAPYGVVALEEIDRVCERLRARKDEPDRGKGWFEGWSAMGALIEKRGDEALARNKKVTAGDYYVRAGIYHY